MNEKEFVKKWKDNGSKSVTSGIYIDFGVLPRLTTGECELPKEGKFMLSWIVKSTGKKESMVCYHDDKGYHGIDDNGVKWSLRFKLSSDCGEILKTREYDLPKEPIIIGNLPLAE